MKNNPYPVRHLAELNFAILFISTSGALGRYIELPAPVTIAVRALLAGVVLFLFCGWKRAGLRVDRQDRGTLLAAGLLMGLHWITYFWALQLAGVAIGMLSLFTYPAITTVLEPALLKTKMQRFHLILSGLVLVGIYFLVPDFSLQSSQFRAVGFGLISAFCYALRNVLMKSRVDRYDGSVLMMYQMIVIAVVLTPCYWWLDTSGIVDYFPFIVLLALLTTAIGHTLFLHSFKHFSTSTASIISCVQPIYGILIGMLFLGEYPALSTLLGGSIILLAVVIEGVRLGRSPVADQK